MKNDTPVTIDMAEGLDAHFGKNLESRQRNKTEQDPFSQCGGATSSLGCLI
jgi:hypothetical protein